MFYTVIAIVPERDVAILAVTNAGGDRAAQAVEATSHRSTGNICGICELFFEE